MRPSDGSRRTWVRSLHGGLIGASLAVLALATTPAGASADTAPRPSTFGNEFISFGWDQTSGHIQSLVLNDKINGDTIPVTSAFSLVLKDGTRINSSQLSLISAPQIVTVTGNPDAARASERSARQTVSFELTDPAGRFRVEWALVQPSAAHYLREEVTVTALQQDEHIAEIELFRANVHGSEVIGKVNGSPVVADHDYWMFENPLSQSDASIGHGTIRLWIDRTLPLQKGQSISYSGVIGATHEGQLRRDFLAYIEAERAHPYRTFLHYNSWYDTGYFTPYTEADAVDRINSIGEELHVKRGVKIDSFLFDDGWDDRTGDWKFSKDFPNGFTPVREAAEKYGAEPGVWLSPWGGYSEPKAQRVKAGQARGYEIVDGGFALSGPKYYANFHAATLNLVKTEGVNQFKFDGTGNANSVVPGSKFDSDFDAAISLIADLRAAKPDLYINLTTGTYPSPSWLRYADSIWRDGDDHNFTGVGTRRQQWITYRDRETYEYNTIAGPLYPLNSIMLHGLIYAQYAEDLNTDPGHDFKDEVHSYFGSGTQLQEMYITPKLLQKEDWDTLAEAANWSRANADVLRDTHWIGGDPGRLDVYGWAAWAPRKGIITLRNPDKRPQTFMLDVGKALELPADAQSTFLVSTPWAGSKSAPIQTIQAGREVAIVLRPFEVLTLELKPTS